MIPKLGRLADSLLLAIENRGTDATGLLALMPNGKCHLQREVKPAHRFVRGRKAMRNEVKTLLLHTRFATVGARDDVMNAHPQINGGMAAVHNGTIYNATELFDAFGLKRHAKVDSEIIPALLSYAGWDHAAEAIDLLDGGAAFAVVDEKHPEELLLARTEGYPLHYLVTTELVIWASTRRAIEAACAMTFGRVPKGKWHEVPEWTMVRVNGKVETTTIRVVKPRPKQTWKAKGKGWSAPRISPTIPPTVTRQLTLDAPVDDYLAPVLVEREPWMEEEVRDLMRYTGVDYRSAFEEVYGVSLADEELLEADDMYVPRSWS
jgi:asparagine synthetase B (glutamine-hydrolysing)